jgi:hypothetical protein
MPPSARHSARRGWAWAVVAGAITVRTNSILTVLAWHAGIAVPLFAVLLCP